ncbi:MAG: hypothetical protein U1E36_05805 [Rickettsiales bacterium]
MLDSWTKNDSETCLAHYLAESQTSSKRYLEAEIASSVFKQLIELTNHYDLATYNLIDAGEKAALFLRASELAGIVFSGQSSYEAAGTLEPDLS